MKLIRLSKKNYGDHNFLHITNKVAYSARRDELVALVVTWCVMLWHAMSHLLYRMRDSTYDFFYTKMQDSVSWRDQQVEFGLNRVARNVSVSLLIHIHIQFISIWQP